VEEEENIESSMPRKVLGLCTGGATLCGVSIISYLHKVLIILFHLFILFKKYK